MMSDDHRTAQGLPLARPSRFRAEARADGDGEVFAHADWRALEALLAREFGPRWRDVELIEAYRWGLRLRAPAAGGQRRLAALDREIRGESAAGFAGMSHEEALAAEVPAARQLIEELVELATVGTVAGLPETHKSFLANE